jgi:hypothetical protein
VQGLTASTIVLFFLVLPGILFREGYKRGGLELVKRREGTWRLIFFPTRDHTPGNKALSRDRPDDYPKNRRPLIEEILQSLVWAVILHAVWVPLVESRGMKVDLSFVAKLLCGPQPPPEQLAQIGRRFPEVLTYFAMLYLASYSFGRFCLTMVRYTKLDLNIMFFRLRDQWFYLLRGDMINFRENRRGKKGYRNVAATVCTLVLDDAKDGECYMGQLVDYFNDTEGALESLVLDSARKSNVEREHLGQNSVAQQSGGDKVPGPRPEDPDSPKYMILNVKKAKLLFAEYIIVERRERLTAKEVADLRKNKLGNEEISGATG